MIYELRTEIYIHSSDPNTPGNLDKFLGKMMICSASSDITKEPREAEGFVAYEIPSAIYISLLHPNTNSNLDTFTTMSGWSSRRGSCFSVLVISFLVVRS